MRKSRIAIFHYLCGVSVHDRHSKKQLIFFDLAKPKERHPKACGGTPL
jgi:hypothetical protein